MNLDSKQYEKLKNLLDRNNTENFLSKEEINAVKSLMQEIRDSSTVAYTNFDNLIKQWIRENDRKEGSLFDMSKYNKSIRGLIDSIVSLRDELTRLQIEQDKTEKEFNELKQYQEGIANIETYSSNKKDKEREDKRVVQNLKYASNEVNAIQRTIDDYVAKLSTIATEIDVRKSLGLDTEALEKEQKSLQERKKTREAELQGTIEEKEALEKQHAQNQEDIAKYQKLIDELAKIAGLPIGSKIKDIKDELTRIYNDKGGDNKLNETKTKLNDIKKAIESCGTSIKNSNATLKETIDYENKISDRAHAVKKTWDEVAYAFRDAWRWIKKVYGVWEDTEDKIMKMARAAGMSAEQAKSLTAQQLENTHRLASVYGTTRDAILEMKQSYIEATERSSYLTDENVEYMTAMSKMFGKETVNNMLVGLDKVGVSVTDTGDIMFMAQQRAKALGLHAGKSTEAIAKNLDKLNKYNFRNGVDGLTRMVLKTQELKTSMDSVMGVVDKFDTIEDSLKNAAGLQMLGGGFASVASNPMGMMYKAWSDPEALFDDVVKAVGGLATMDKNTGEMKINPVDMHRIKAAADAMGISAQELTNIAKQESRRKIIDAELSKGNQLSKDKDKRAIEEAYIKNKSYFDSETKQNVINIIKENGEIEKKAITAVTAEEIAQSQALDINEENAFKDIRAIREHLTGPISDQLKEQAQNMVSAKERREGIVQGFMAGAAKFMSPFAYFFKDVILNTIGSLIPKTPGGVLFAGGLVGSVLGPFIKRQIFGRQSGSLINRGARGVAKNGGHPLKPWTWFKGQPGAPVPPSQTPPPPPGPTPPPAPSTGTAKPITRNIRVRKGNGGTGMSVRYRRPTPARGRVTPPGSSGFKFKGGGGKGMIAMTALMIGSQLLSSKQPQEEKPTSNISSANTNVNEGECSICELVKLAIERNELLSTLAGVRRTEEKQEEIQEEESVASKAGDTVMTAAYLAGEKTTASVTSKAVSSIAGKTAGQMAGKVAGTVLKGAIKGSLYSMAGDLLNQGLVAGGVIEEGGHINKLLNIGTRAAEWGAYGSVIPGVGTTIGATAGAIYEVLNQYRDSDAVNYILGKRTSEEERALLKQQSDFETGKIGYTDITDPALMEKAAMATIGIHDLLITKWNREEGKRDDGTEKGMIEEYVDNMSNNFEKIPIVGKPLADANKWVYDKISNFFGEENGGIIPDKAEKGLLVSKGGSDAIEGMMENTASSVMSSIGAMIPGDSYTGDKVHVMANSGEMILNKAEQKSLFELLKSGGKSGMLGVAGLISSSLFGNKEGGNVKNPISSILDSVGNFVFGDNNVDGKDSILSKILFAVNKIAGIETPNANGVVSDTIKETNESKFNEIIVRKLNNDNISSLYTETVKPSEPIGSVPSNVSQYRETMIYGGGNTTVSDINVNISGTIRLEGANGGVGIDFNELMNNAEFRRQIVEMVKERLNTQGTGGKMNKESMSYNTSMMYNRT